MTDLPVSPWYNPTYVSPNTRALAESINNELTKIRAAFDQLPPPGGVGTGGVPIYTHFAYADSADGTANFTTGSAGARSYVGIQANSASPTPSGFPADYQWSRIGAPSQDDLTLELNEVQAQAAQALLDAATAISNAATAQATADGKVTSFFQNEPPLAEGIGDLWIDTNDGNKPYRWNGSVWAEIRDAGIGVAITAASTAQATADGKIVTFYQASPPTGSAIGDLWIDTDDSNKLYRWNGVAWVAARDAGIALAQSLANDAGAAAAAAQASANTANTAISAITSDGILSRDEKPEIRKQRDEIISERPIIRARAVALGISVTTYDAEYTALIAYLGGLELDTAVDTSIDRTLFNKFFTDYFAARQVVLDGIADESSKRASSLPLGDSNRVPFSRMEGNNGWAVLFNPVPLAVSTDYGQFNGLRFFRAQATATAAGQQISIGNGPFPNPAFKVTPSERLSIQARIECAGAAAQDWQLEFWTFDPDGVTQSAIVLGFGAAPVDISGFNFQAFVDVPAGRVFGRLEFRVRSNGPGLLQAVISEPMVTSAAPGQTVHPPFTAGPNAVDGATRNTGVLADLDVVDAGGPLLIGELPPGKADPNLRNVNVVLAGTLAARPASGSYLGQTYAATDTREFFRWDGFIWQPTADVTVIQQRSILAQFPVIEIKQGEAGNVGVRTVTHKAYRAGGTVELTGGTWSLVAEDLGSGDATVNSSTGTVDLSGIGQSGKYVLLYVHTDGLSNLAEFNVTYVPSPAAAAASARTGRATSTNGTDNTNDWQTIMSLTVNNVPAGRVTFGSLDLLTGVSRLSVTSATGTADYEARLTVDGTPLTSVLSQPVVSGGVLQFSEWSQLFAGSYPVTSGNRTFAIQMRRTSGTGRILSTNTALEPTIIAT